MLEDEYAIIGIMFLLTPPRVFLNYGQLFPETFLYLEEWATIFLLYKASLKCNFINTDIVLHKGATSTPDNVKNLHLRNKKWLQKILGK